MNWLQNYTIFSSLWWATGPEKHVVWFVWASSIPQCIAQHMRKGISVVVAKGPIACLRGGSTGSLFDCVITALYCALNLPCIVFMSLFVFMAVKCTDFLNKLYLYLLCLIDLRICCCQFEFLWTQLNVIHLKVDKFLFYHHCMVLKCKTFPLLFRVSTYLWLSARLQYLKCISNGDTAVLH